MNMLDTSDDQAPLFSFAVVTDTHLSVDADGAAVDERAPNNLTSSYRRTLERINEMGPAFVVHLGDMADPVPVSPRFAAAAAAFKEASSDLKAPLHLVPGNHDIGEKIHKALPRIDKNVSITPASIAQYQDTYGPDYYHFEQGGCLFLVLNTLLINSGLQDEHAQWDWLSEALEKSDGKRVFVFTHYPAYLAERHEPDYYDNLEEPGRSRLLEQLAKANTQVYFAGHVHNFFYNEWEGIEHAVLPSVGILRTDYMEMFRASPSRELGSFDPAKLGFLWVDVYAEGHALHLVRSDHPPTYRPAPQGRVGSTVTIDLRLPWCETTDIPCAWGLEIFERKHIRNDYPLAALWEMGGQNFRIPISDLLDARTADRMRQLGALGHRFSIVSFGYPDEARMAAINAHLNCIKSLEVVALLDQWQDLAPQLTALRKDAPFEIYLNVVRPEVEGWTSHHGLKADAPDELQQALLVPGLSGAVDGFVFAIGRDVSPLEGVAAVYEHVSGTGFKPLFHLPSVGMFWSTKDTKTRSEAMEVARVAEAALVARARPDADFVIDNFVELERGYVSCHGLVDRFYNPKTGSRVLSALNRHVPAKIWNVQAFETLQARMLTAASEHYDLALILAPTAEADRTHSSPSDRGLLHTKGTCIRLDTGEIVTASIDEYVKEIALGDGPIPPALCLVAKQD